jgi:hypothetical protein
MTVRTLPSLAAAAALLLTGTAFAAEEKWEVSTSVEMSGMPFRMPATTLVVCVPPGKMSDERIVQQEGCSVGKMTRSGNTTRFTIQCTAPQALTGEATITRQGPDAYSGTMTAKGTVDGRALEMKATYAGRKIGVCDASKAQGSLPVGAGGMPNGIQFDGVDMSDPKIQEGLRQLQDMYGR